MAEQMSFSLPVDVSLGEEDFYVSEANAQAYALISDDAAWPEGKLCLTGPSGSGKSHLVRVWQTRSNAQIWRAADITGGDDLPAPGSRIAVEDMEHLPREAEEFLFHVHNHLKATGGALLVTSQTPPPQWPIALPDLMSRMQAATLVRITEPDDALLNAVLLKHFADRQLMPAPNVLTYISSRTERSLAAISAIVAQLDAAALSRKSAITRGLARDVLEAASHHTPSK